MEPAVPYTPTEFKDITGASDEEYKAVRDGIAQLEGARYGQMGGSSGRFAGRYQMGGQEIASTARSLGETPPSTAQFLADPRMQERYFERYTLNHYKRLMRDPNFARLPLQRRLEILGYAHNQGEGGAMAYLRSGVVGHDAFGTGGNAYEKAIHDRLVRPSLHSIMKSAAPPVSPFGGLDRGAFGPGRAPAPGSATTTNNKTSSLNYAPVYNFTGGGDQFAQASHAQMLASRGAADLHRRMQVASA